jgi:hypothetical protein
MVSSSRIKNISVLTKPDSRYIKPIPSRSEGRFMIVTNVGRVAVDAEVPITNGADAYGEVVWS